MKRAVWKYDIPHEDEFELTLPPFEPLTFACQDGALRLWVLVWPEEPPKPARFRLAGTGHPLEAERLLYIGTAFEGPWVWHLFEVPE